MFKIFPKMENALLYFFSGVAVIGIALIAMGEEVGSDMTYRTMSHLVSTFTDNLYGLLK